MRYLSFPVLFLFVLLLSTCDDILDGITPADSFWEKLAGEWRLGPTYKINSETFSVSSCDQFTVLAFRELSEEELDDPTSGTSLTVDEYLTISNQACVNNLLTLGSIINSNINDLPASFNFKVRLIRDCANCTYADIQSIDIENIQTADQTLSIKSLSGDQLVVIITENIYNREFNDQPILDTLEYTFNKGGADIFTVSEFEMNDFPKVEWLSFTNSIDCPTLASENICNDGIDDQALCFDSPNAYASCIENSLKSAMGADNELTLSFWIKPASVAWPKQIIYSKYDNTAGPFILSLEGQRFTLEVNNGFGQLQKFSSIRSIIPDEWNHIVLSYRDEDLLLCINGVIDRRDQINSWLYDAGGTILLGNSQHALDNDLGHGFVGQIDEMIFFENYLNQDIIYQIYQWHLNN